jgi:hypothetical protein
VSDRTQSTRPVPNSFRRRLIATREGRIFAAVVLIVALLIVLVGGHLYGRYLAALDLGGRDNTIEQLRAESQKEKRDSDSKSAQLTNLQNKLDGVQATLNAIMPSANTYNITPNQSLIIADGHLTVGLVGAPGNESITLEINGKPQTASAGQVIPVVTDASTNCQVAVQSFDMFKAVLVATCSGAKPQ